jgi:hypothetical protein
MGPAWIIAAQISFAIDVSLPWPHHPQPRQETPRPPLRVGWHRRPIQIDSAPRAELDICQDRGRFRPYLYRAGYRTASGATWQCNE